MKQLEEKKERINGVLCNYLCQIQNVNGIGNVYPAHYHSYIEILYGIEGNYQILLNGKPYHFGEGDLVIINSKEVHQIDTSSTLKGKYVVLRFEPETFYNSMFESGLQLKYVMPFILETSNHQKVIRKQDVDNSCIPDLLYQILEEYKEQSYGYELAIKNHIGRIFLWILRYLHQSGTCFSMGLDINTTRIKCLQPALDYILTHYNEQLKATDLAILCGMSYSHFSRTFNKEMKMNFSEYINYIRIMEAERLLITTEMNITEIALIVGFTTTSYFIKLFKHYKKVSPRRFRAECRLSL